MFTQQKHFMISQSKVFAAARNIIEEVLFKLVQSLSFVTVALAISSCGDEKGMFVSNGDTTNVESIANPRATNFLKNMRDVANRPKTGVAPLAKQSFDNLFEYIKAQVGNAGEDIRVEVRQGPNMTIDPAVNNHLNKYFYIDYSVTAEKAGEGNRQIVISWSGNFTINGKRVQGQTRLINYGDDHKVYLFDPNTDDWHIVDVDGIRNALDESIPH